ncbi:MAG: CapA family protein [Lentimicrobiaceae bacterium]|nr:CapA family protein [Lentimicrobiaceae bacterium]
MTKKRFALLLLLLFVVNYTALGQKRHLAADTNNSDVANKVSLMFVGDIMQHMPQITSAKVGDDEYDYNHCFKHVKPLLSSADFTIVNLETTLAGKPYSGYPQFSAPDAIVPALINSGVDIISTANNHSCDKGAKGIRRTIAVLDSLNVERIGTYLDYNDKYEKHPLIINKNDIKIALLNYTYGTNGLPVPSPLMVNLIHYDSIRNDIETAKLLKPDKIIVYIHWGTEYQLLPDSSQIKTANFLFDNGVDIIIGSHPHVVQPMAWHKRNNINEKDKLVVWSLGNFVSNQRKINTDGGAMVKIEIEKKGNLSYIKNANYYLTWVNIAADTNSKKYNILPSWYIDNDTIVEKNQKVAFDLFLNNTRKHLNINNINISEGESIGDW